MADVSCAIIGGGVIGRSIALALTSKGWSDVIVIDACRGDRVENQSTRNSGVIHAGIYYSRAQRPLKAKLCVLGNRLLYDFCRERDVPHANTGKLVVALDDRERGYLDGIQNIAKENGVPNVRMLSASEAREMEPNIRASAALLVPTSGIVDSAAYLSALQRACTAHNLSSTKVVALGKRGEDFELETSCAGRSERFTSRWVVNAAGIYADEVAQMLSPGSVGEFSTARGESAKFYRSRRLELFVDGRSIYPVPCGFFPSGRRAEVSYEEFVQLLQEGKITETLGVHLTPTLSQEGNLSDTMSIGPAITPGVHREDYGHNLLQADTYLSRVQAFFPAIREEDIHLHQCGIQARLPGQRDWQIQADPSELKFINLLGVDSPGMTASLAIGQYVENSFLTRRGRP